MDTPVTLQDTAKILDHILKIISCPVCYNSLRPPVAVCENGHSTCPDCKKKISTCPLCKKPLQIMKNRQFDEILDAIPRPCRFEGCQVFVRIGGDHEEWCGYRNTDCKMTHCNWKGSVRCLEEHLLEDHPTRKVMTHMNEGWSYINIKPCTESWNTYSPILAHGQVFWNHTTNDPTEQMFKITFYCLPIEKIVDSFKVTVTLIKTDKKYSTSILILAKNATNEEENCICLHSSFVQTFMNESDGTLIYSLSIEKERKMLKRKAKK